MKSAKQSLPEKNRSTALMALMMLMMAGACEGAQQQGHRLQANGPIEPPNIHHATNGFNALIGRTPSEQRRFPLIGSELFELTEIPGESQGGYKTYKEVGDMSAELACKQKTRSNEIWWATSSSSLRSQSERGGSGIEGEIDLGIEVPLGQSGATLSAGTTLGFAHVFGNSETSVTAFESKSAGFTRSFDAYAQRTLYGLEFDYDAITTWNADFVEACRELGDDPSQTQVLQFFAEYGTHGLRAASFGQRCTSSLFLEEGASSTSYSNFLSDTSSYENRLLWWKSSGSQTETSEETTSSEHGLRYQISDKRCEGELEDDSSCENLKGTGRNSPSILEWKYKPIWEMPVPGLSQGGRNKMANLFQDILLASARCADNNCNGNGVCAPNQFIWDSIDREITLDEFYDGSKCFCFDDIEGDKCNQRRDSFAKTAWEGYENAFDEPFVVDRPFCGISSIHNSHNEDRLFRFKYCQPRAAASSGLYKEDPTPFDSHWKAECLENEVVAYLGSRHNNRNEDRSFELGCGSFHGWETDPNSCVWSSWVNNFDDAFDFECDGAESVITGIESQHDDHHEDRRFKFQCCRWTGTVTVPPGPSLAPLSVAPVAVPEVTPNTLSPTQSPSVAPASESNEEQTGPNGDEDDSASREEQTEPNGDEDDSASREEQTEPNGDEDDSASRGMEICNISWIFIAVFSVLGAL